MSEPRGTLLFSGRKRDWGCFKVRFIALSYRQDFQDVLLKQKTIPSSIQANLSDDERKLIKNKTLDIMSFSCQ